jgi:hypothetical protein
MVYIGDNKINDNHKQHTYPHFIELLCCKHLDGTIFWELLLCQHPYDQQQQQQFHLIKLYGCSY